MVVASARAGSSAVGVPAAARPGAAVAGAAGTAASRVVATMTTGAVAARMAFSRNVLARAVSRSGAAAVTGAAPAVAGTAVFDGAQVVLGASASAPPVVVGIRILDLVVAGARFAPGPIPAGEDHRCLAGPGVTRAGAPAILAGRRSPHRSLGRVRATTVAIVLNCDSRSDRAGEDRRRQADLQRPRRADSAQGRPSAAAGGGGRSCRCDSTAGARPGGSLRSMVEQHPQQRQRDQQPEAVAQRQPRPVDRLPGGAAISSWLSPSSSRITIAARCGSGSARSRSISSPISSRRSASTAALRPPGIASPSSSVGGGPSRSSFSAVLRTIR
jgi:hypothetical protein